MQWIEALDRGGMEQVVLYPTLGLFMSFLKDREWAVRLGRVPPALQAQLTSCQH